MHGRKKGFAMRVFALVAYAALSLLMQVIPATAAEPRRSEMPLMYDVRGVNSKQANLVVERLVRASLARDASGNAYIQGSPCTTPNNLRDSILAYHPDLADAIPTITALPDFLHVLIPSEKPAREMGLTGTFTLSRMQCLKPGSLQKGDRLDQAGFDREFQPGEYVWYHPNHTAPVIAGDCTNVIKPKPVSLPAPQSVRNDCYVIPFDYFMREGVVWDDQHRARVSAHLDATEEELEEEFNDSCFFVHDETGDKKPFHRCEFCTGGEYPPRALALAVGLPGKAPEGVLSFRLKDGKGYLSLRKEWAIRRGIYCVVTSPYPVSVSSFERYTAVSRFDLVEPNEIRSTVSEGTLNRILSGEKGF
jgi:hypothetical protein